MFDNPFVLLLVFCGGPILSHAAAVWFGWWIRGRGYYIGRRGARQANPEPSGVGYAAPVPEHLQGRPIPTRQAHPVVDRIARQ